MSTPKVNLVGRIFGHLTVLKQADDYVSPKGRHWDRWLCQCDCGKQKEINASSLLRGISTSCGHVAPVPKTKHTELVGKKFGELTVLEDDGTRRQHGVAWKCRCSCGNIAHVRTTALTSGTITSCGHESRKNVEKMRLEMLANSPDGTNLSLIGQKPYTNNKTGERNISYTRRKGVTKYEVKVQYKGKVYGSVRSTLAEAIQLREELRTKYWPNYTSNPDR